MSEAVIALSDEGTGRVLIVDDDRDFAESLEEIMEASGFEALVACSAKEAEQTLCESSADVVLIDVRLGSADGMDLIGKFQQRWPEKLYIAMTAYASIESALLALKNGAYDFLRKPFHPDELFASLNRALGRVRLEREQRSAQELLAASERRFRELTEGSVQGVYVHRDWNALYVNPAFATILGYDSPTALMAALPDLSLHVADQERTRMRRVVDSCQQSPDTIEPFDYEGLRRDGTAVMLQGFARVVNWDGVPVVQCAVVDVTDERQALRRLRLQEQIISSTADLMAFVGLDARLEAVNDAWATAFGRSVQDCIGQPLSAIDPEMGPRTRFAEAFEVCVNGEQSHVKAWFELPGAGRRFMDVALYPYRGVLGGSQSGEAGVVMAWRDLTETRDLSEKLSFQATHDGLTGVWNRRAFEERLSEAVNEGIADHGQHALCYLDLDQFKVVNDTCGHLAGDELLRQLGTMLPRVVRKDDLFARLGGDEFAVLMYRCGMSQATRAAEDLLNAVRQFRFSWQGNSFALTASVGLAAIDPNCESVSAIMSRADRACYAAKESGRDRLHVYRADDEHLAKRHGEMRWVNRLTQALEQSRFELWAQRIRPVKGVSQSALGAHHEVLLRLRDETGGIVPPGAFLPAAERYQLASRVDAWVFDATFNWLSESHGKLEKGGRLFMNLSGHSLADEALKARIVERVRSNEVPGDSIGFEITETAAIANLSQAERFIDALREFGCSFALDDFGSGLSSFGYLKTLPVDYLKIDGLFVKDILRDPIDLAMVRSINEIGHIMGKKTVAESVENEAVLLQLEAMGVDFVQGYLVGLPAPLSELSATIALDESPSQSPSQGRSD